MNRIYKDFGNLGYNKKIITKAKISAKAGRDHELRIRSGEELQRNPRERGRYHIGVPYHSAANGYRHRLRQQGVDLTFSSRNSIIRRITRKDPTHTDSGIYILTCKKTDCEMIYVGQSEDIPERLKQHTGATTQASKRYYTSATHSRLRGHEMDTTSQLVPFRSNSLSHRLVVETSLISACHTILGNKASSSTHDIDILSPMILQGASIDWKVIAVAQPNRLKPEVIPRHCKKFFRQQGINQVVRPPTTENFPSPPNDNTALQVPPRYYLRSHRTAVT